MLALKNPAVRSLATIQLEVVLTTSSKSTLEEEMKSTITLCVLTILCTTLTVTECWARKIEHWPYSRLQKEADLVLVARAQTSHPLQEIWSHHAFEKNRFQGTATRFSVGCILKGKAPKEIEVVHFQYRDGAIPFNDGPRLASFIKRQHLITTRQHGDGDGTSRELKPKEKSLTNMPEYLLFLKQRKDGRYEAVSGQMDPILSVRELVDAR